MYETRVAASPSETDCHYCQTKKKAIELAKKQGDSNWQMVLERDLGEHKAIFHRVGGSDWYGRPLS